MNKNEEIGGLILKNYDFSFKMYVLLRYFCQDTKIKWKTKIINIQEFKTVKVIDLYFNWMGMTESGMAL